MFNPGTNAVSVSWGASAGADHYQLQRLDHGVWGASVDVHATNVSYTFAAGVTYVFHVRAVDSSGGSASNYTANDLATTMSFTSIQAGVTNVAFSHFDQILTAINSVLLANNDGPKTWSGILGDIGSNKPVPTSNGIIYADHILALRTRTRGHTFDLRVQAVARRTREAHGATFDALAGLVPHQNGTK